MEHFGKGFTATNIKYMRLFYIAFPIGHALRDQLQKGKKQLQISHALSDQSLSKKQQIWDLLRTELSWTHYRLLPGVENIEARKYYMNEAADNNWSTRLLERQITSLYFERLLSTKKKKELLKNPTIGIVLCSEKNETIAKYSVLNESKRLFASKYKLFLPTEKELVNELKTELKLYNKKKSK